MTDKYYKTPKNFHCSNKRWDEFIHHIRTCKASAADLSNPSLQHKEDKFFHPDHSYLPTSRKFKKTTSP